MLVIHQTPLVLLMHRLPRHWDHHWHQGWQLLLLIYHQQRLLLHQMLKTKFEFILVIFSFLFNLPLAILIVARAFPGSIVGCFPESKLFPAPPAPGYLVVYVLILDVLRQCLCK
jgi:hypothetical protein